MRRGEIIFQYHAFAVISALLVIFSPIADARIIQRRLQNFTPINITSPGYPSNYPTNVNDAWQISAPPGFRIIARPGFLDLERNTDFIRFGDEHGSELIRLTGRAAPRSILSPAAMMWMNFTSDGSSAAKGFQIEVSIFNETRVRLVGGTTLLNGRVEVRLPGSSQWGTVSSHEWNLKDAATVCKELGLPGAVSAVTNAHYGAGTGPVLLTQVDCNSDHFRLEDCPSLSPCNGCPHNQDAGVNCHGPNYLGCFFLSNLGSSSAAGSVEQCVAKCEQQNRRYAALSGDRCVCRDAITFPESAEEDTMCDRKCSGNPNEACGSVSDPSIYSVHDTFFARCRDPGVPLNATRTGNSFQLGSKVRYNCSQGYDLVGNWTLTCLAGKSFQDVMWSSEMPFCKAQIDNNTMPTNATITSQPQTANNNTTIIIVVIVVIACIIFLIVLIVCVCRCRRKGRCGGGRTTRQEMWY